MGYEITIGSRTERSHPLHTAKTVNGAFNWFLSNVVNLDPAITKTARTSRDWLLDQIHLLPQKHDDFPLLYPERDIHFGSFARRTKIRELDDIDLIVGVNAVGATYYDSGGTITISVPEATRLRRLCFDGSNHLNPTKVINRFVKHLSGIPQYRKAEIRRDGSAAVLNLTSYSWSFDIVPGFFTTPEWDGRTYYLIPGGKGHWMKTDPTIDRDRLRTINQMHNGNVHNVVRLLKYWNRRPTMPGAPSYLFECLVLNYYESGATRASEFVDLEISSVLKHVGLGVLYGVQDPKRIQGDINKLPWDDRVKISNRAMADAAKASTARNAEIQGDYKESIRLWREIFGPAFPAFG